MKKAELIEALILLTISSVGIAEGVRLMSESDPNAVKDILGPGVYVLIASICLMAISTAYLCMNYRKKYSIKKIAINKEARNKMMSMAVVLVAYGLLICLSGYLIATIIFFLLEFRIAGVTSWRTNIIWTLVLTGAYYVIFVEYCTMSFPRGILF
jgi:hypothetical protein